MITHDYSKCSIWELAARHSVARNKRHYITCELIQQEVAKRPLCERVIVKKLNYYQPIEIDADLWRVA